MTTLPTAPLGTDQKLNLFLRSVKIAIENGTKVNVSDLDLSDIESRLALLEETQTTGVTGGGSGSSPGNDGTVFDLTDTDTPPALTGLTVSATRSFVIVEWDSPSYGNQAYVTIYRSTIDDPNTAEKIGTSRFQIYSDYVPDLASYYYWIASTSWGGVEGPLNSANGALATSLGIISKSFDEGTPTGQEIGDVWYVGTEVRTWDGSIWVTQSTVGADFTDNLINIPVELEDGRIGTAIDSDGFLQSGLNSVISAVTLMDAITGANISRAPEFLAGSMDGYAVYNNAGGNSVTISTLLDDTAPNSSGYVLRYSYDGIGPVSPNFGGIIQRITLTQSAGQLQPGNYVKNSRILYKIVAKIPVGMSIDQASNPTGDGGTFNWLTQTDGTGEWQTYLGVRIIGATGVFSTTGHLHFFGGVDAAFTVDFARYDQIVLDATNTQFIGTTFRDSDGNGLIDTAVKNEAVTINNDGTLTNAGGGQVLVAQLVDSGALAVKSSVDLATADVTNKSLANVDSSQDSKLNGIDPGADVTDYDDTRVTNVIEESNTLTVRRPGGSSFSSNSSSLVGILKVKLPQSFTDTMMRFHIDVYSFIDDQSFSLVVGGYNDNATQAWIKTSASLSGAADANNRVRFGHDGTNCVVYIGEIGTIWSFPKVTIRDFQAGHSNFERSKWENGWSIVVENNETGFVQTGVNYPDALLDARSITGQGQLAILNDVDFLSLVSGAEKPENNATLGAAFDSNITGQINPANITTYVANLAVNTAQIALASIGDAQVGLLGADKIVAASLSALSVNAGDITAGVLRNTDNNFIIDLSAKRITMAGPNGQVADDYMTIENGKIVSFEWTGSAHQPANALRTIEVGTASNGVRTTLSNYYASQPKITVTANDTPIYKAANTAQDQTIQIRAENISETVPGTWAFDPISRLVLGDGTSNFSANDINGPSTSGTVTSAIYFSPASTSNVTVSVDLTSIRGTGTAGSYYYRQVTWTIYYRVKNSGLGYSSTSAGVSTFGNSIALLTDTQLVTFPSANEWDFYIQGVYSDAGGTFSTGGAGFDYDTATTQNTTQTTLRSGFQRAGIPREIYAANLVMNLPSYTPPAGWTVDSVDYVFVYSFYLYADREPSTSIARSEIMKSGVTRHLVSVGAGQIGSDGDENLIVTQQHSYSSSSYDISSGYSYRVEIEGGTFDEAKGEAEIRGYTFDATITIKKPWDNSTTQSNTLFINDFSYTLSGSSVLDTGTLGYMAIL